MDVYKAYAAGTGIYCFLQGISLSTFPSIILNLLSEDVHKITPLENYLCASLGLAISTLGLLVFLLTGTIPVTSSLASKAQSRLNSEIEQKGSPYHVPVLWISGIYHTACALLSYYTGHKSTRTHYLACTISASLALLAGWCGLFATANGEINRKSVFEDLDADRSGKDTKSRTSGFPFSNVHHDKNKKL